MKDESLLRAHAARRLRALPLAGAPRVVELGGRAGGDHARLFRERGCAYRAVGFEGDVTADLRTPPLPLPDASCDLVLVSMVLMYCGEPAAVPPLLAECRRILAPGGRLVIVEPFLYGDTPHRDLPDRVRWTADGLRALVEDAGFARVTVARLGGAAGLLLAVMRDLLPGRLRFARALCTRAGYRLDALAARAPWGARRPARYYVGHFTVAERS
jgi:SAM-dependent methyltransferase